MPTDTPPSPPAAATPPTSDLIANITRQGNEVADLKRAFFNDQAEQIAACCQKMAELFDDGGTLYAMGNGGSSSDAIHTSVEFMHPIIQKRPALPSIALTTDEAIMTAVGNDQDFSMVYVEQLRMLAKPGDMALGVSTSGKSSNINRAMKLAAEKEMLTLGFTGKDGGPMPDLCTHCFVIPSYSIPRIQEVHETLLHIIWDQIHVIRGEENVL